MPVAEPIQKVVENVEVKKKFHPNYRVILHNDDGVGGEYVVEVLMTVMQFSQTKAVSIMLEAHQTGKGQVIVCSSEEYAEAHSDNLNSRGLTTTVEPMEVG